MMTNLLVFPTPSLRLDGSRKEYLYKFIPAFSNNAAYALASEGAALGAKGLEGGKLYSAKFYLDGTGQWMEHAAQAGSMQGTQWSADCVEHGDIYLALTSTQYPEGQIVRIAHAGAPKNAGAFTWRVHEQGLREPVGLFIGTVDSKALFALSPAERIALAEDMWEEGGHLARR